MTKQNSLVVTLIDRAALPPSTGVNFVEALYFSLRDTYEAGSAVQLTNGHYVLAQCVLEEGKRKLIFCTVNFLCASSNQPNAGGCM